MLHKKNEVLDVMIRERRRSIGETRIYPDANPDPDYPGTGGDTTPSSADKQPPKSKPTAMGWLRACCLYATPRTGPYLAPTPTCCLIWPLHPLVAMFIFVVTVGFQ